MFLISRKISSEELFPKLNSFCNFRASFHSKRVGPCYVHIVDGPGPVPTRFLPEVCCGYIRCPCLGKVCPPAYQNLSHAQVILCQVGIGRIEKIHSLFKVVHSVTRIERSLVGQHILEKKMK